MTRAARTWMVVTMASLFVGACKSEKPQPGPAPAQGGAAEAKPPEAAPAAPTAAAPKPALPDPDTLCRSPALACLFLGTAPVEQASEAWCKACAGSKWLADPAKCDAGWLTSADRTDGDYDYARNCVYASRGYTFKKKEWQRQFGNQSWYKPRADFKDSDLTDTETKNIAALKARAAAVREQREKDSKVSAAEQKLVESWLKALAGGSPDVPAKLTLHGEAVGKDEFLKSAKEAQFNIKTLSAYSDTGGRVLWVSDANPTPDCEDESCEGFWSIRFDLDAKGKVVAISLDAAACPFVYVAGADRASVLEGEILRNLRHPGLEGTQRLALASLASPAGACQVARTTIRIAEEKLETTYLDAVALELDDHLVRPAACAGAPSPAYCHDDGRRHAVGSGEALELVFVIPSGATCHAPALVADGYYLPK